MKKIIRFGTFVAAASFVVMLWGCTKDQGEERAVEGGLAPNVAFADSGGNSWNVSDFRGKVVAVHFWATWCPPCRTEIPELERMYRDFKGRAFQLLPVLFNDDLSKGTRFLQVQGATMPLLTDESGVGGVRYGVTGVPETYLIDKKGVLRKAFIGPVSWDDPSARAFVENLLKE